MRNLVNVDTTVRHQSSGAALVFLALLLPTTIASTANAVTIDFLTIGNPNNAVDPADGDVFTNGVQHFGAVSYTYKIGKFDVTCTQYVEYLNAKDPFGDNPHGIYNDFMGNFSGVIRNPGNPDGLKYSVLTGFEKRPMTSVDFYQAIRFANWLNNGQFNSDTESGAYTLLGGTPIPTNADSITRNSGATIVLPTENEWYKAAYYNPATNSYFAYPSSSNNSPTPSAPTSNPNSANLGNVDGNLTEVGAYTGTMSPYGAFDMAGNVFEWNETLIGSFRGHRGAAFFNGEMTSRSDNRSAGPPTDALKSIGFRLASVPAGPLKGDINVDEHVNAADIQAMLVALADLNAYRTAHNNLSDSDLLAIADVNQDGGVTNADAQSLLNLLKSGGGSLATVPEPATVQLMLAALVIGCVGNAVRSRRRIQS